jgi:predicted nucleic acid-binding protein
VITYVDTSVIVKLIIDEPESDHASMIWTSAASLAACQLAHVEARAALASAHREGRVTSAELDNAEANLVELWSQLYVVDVDESLVRHAGDLARLHALRGYDAVHLGAALFVGARVMAVSDGRLARAARECGIAVAVPSELALADVVHLTGPVVEIMHRWLEAIVDRGDLATAWPLTEPDFRLALVQSWLWEGFAPQVPNVEVAAALLAEPDQPAHPLWDEFAAWRMGRWKAVLPDYVIDPSRRGTVSSPYISGVDLEAVMISDNSTGARILGGRTVEVQRFSVRHTVDGVLVSGVGAALPVPGWPPTEIPLPPLPADPQLGERRS